MGRFSVGRSWPAFRFQTEPNPSEPAMHSALNPTRPFPARQQAIRKSLHAEARSELRVEEPAPEGGAQLIRVHVHAEAVEVPAHAIHIAGQQIWRTRPC